MPGIETLGMAFQPFPILPERPCSRHAADARRNLRRRTDRSLIARRRADLLHALADVGEVRPVVAHDVLGKLLVDADIPALCDGDDEAARAPREPLLDVLGPIVDKKLAVDEPLYFRLGDRQIGHVLSAPFD